MKKAVWVIEDDKQVFEMIKDYLSEMKLLKKIDLKRFSSVPEALKCEGRVDLMTIDTTAIAGHGIQPLGCWDLFSSNLRYLIEKHTSAIIGVYSAVGVWAEDLVEDMKEAFKDDIVIEQVGFLSTQENYPSVWEFIKRYV